MSEINLYPEMNEKIADLLLGCEDNPMSLYAGVYIKHLEQKLKRKCPRKNIRRYFKKIASNIERIGVDKRIMGGMPVLDRTRIPVSLIIACFRDGMTHGEICEEYRLKYADIEGALEYVVEILDSPYRED